MYCCLIFIIAFLFPHFSFLIILWSQPNNNIEVETAATGPECLCDGAGLALEWLMIAALPTAR